MLNDCVRLFAYLHALQVTNLLLQGCIHLPLYYQWHGLRVPKARLAELPRDEPTNILAHLEQENNQMQRRLNRFHAIQKARKHLKWKAQQRAIKSINEVTTLDDEKDISDFSNSSNDDFQKFLPTNIRRC